MRMASISFLGGLTGIGQRWRTLDVFFDVSMTSTILVLLLPLTGCTGAQTYDPPFNPNEKAEKQIPPFMAWECQGIYPDRRLFMPIRNVRMLG